jgi:hypothetical protein
MDYHRATRLQATNPPRGLNQAPARHPTFQNRDVNEQPPPPSCAPAWRYRQGQALRVLRNLDAAGRGRQATTDSNVAVFFRDFLREIPNRSQNGTTCCVCAKSQHYTPLNKLYELYLVHLITRNSFGLMTRKLSVTESQRSAQFRGTFSRRKLSVASANWAHVA